MDFKARTLDQILAELNPSFNPQIENVKQKQALIPQTVKADIDQAKAEKDTAFDSIISGARRRGTGVAFCGIPLGEQAKYASTVFAPEVLRARARGSQQALTLEDTLLGIQERQGSTAREIFQREKDRELQLQLAREQEAAADRRARASAAAFSPSLGVNPSAGGGADPEDAVREGAYLEVQERVGGQSDKELISDFNATAASARRGNARDKIKLEVYRQARPDLFIRPPDNAKFGGRYDTPLAKSFINVPGAVTPFGRATNRQTVFSGTF